MSSLDPAADRSQSDRWAAVAEGSHYNPHEFLGAHTEADAAGRTTTTIRVRRPHATAVTAVFVDGTRMPLVQIGDGLWQVAHPGPPRVYRVATVYADGSDDTVGDPYRHEPSITDLDVTLFEAGRHEQLWRVLGAHPRTISTEHGVSFAVWAPHAQSVRVIGDHNDWSGQAHAMRALGASGVWELFIPGVTVGTHYQYEILTAAGNWITRPDPMAQATAVDGRAASVVTHSAYVWNDGTWMTRRASTPTPSRPMSIWSVDLADDLRTFGPELIGRVQSLGFTHVELRAVSAQSLYAPIDPDGLRHFVDTLHGAGIGVLLTWTPGQFPTAETGLSRFDGQPLYESSQPGMARRFAYDRAQVRGFLLANALYWLAEFHFDGLRVNDVTPMLSLDTDGEVLNIHGGHENFDAIRLLQEVNATIERAYPGTVTIAEASTNFPGVTARADRAGLGFGLTWNTGWRRDSISYLQRAPRTRAQYESAIVLSFVSAFSERYVLPVSSAAELIALLPGDLEQRLADARAYLGFMWAHPGKKLLLAGAPVTQLEPLFEALNQVYRAHSALWERDDDGMSLTRITGPSHIPNLLAFVRRDDRGSTVLIVSNFAAETRTGVELDLPASGVWETILTTDATAFGGHGSDPHAIVIAPDSGGHHHRATLSVPAQTTIWLRHQPRAHIPSPIFG